VIGKRFTYRFVIDLRELVGYSAQDLHRLVQHKEEKETAANKRRRATAAVGVRSSPRKRK